MTEGSPIPDQEIADLRARLRTYFFAVRLTRRGLLPVVLVLAFLGVHLAVHALAPKAPDGEPHPLTLLLAGANVAPLIEDGEWWRVPASIFLHADALHLAVNSVGAFFLAQFAENVFGTSRAVLLFLWGGTAGAIASALWSETASVGASGALFALLGALVAFTVVRRRAIPPPLRRVLLAGVALWLVAALWQGDDARTVDQAAHLSGMLSGAAASLAFGPRLPVFSLAPMPAPRPVRVAAVASVLVALFAVGTALRHLVVGPGMAHPRLVPLDVEGLFVPIPVDWPHGRLVGTCLVDPMPVSDLLRSGSVVCFRDAYGSLFLVGPAPDVLGGVTLDPLLTFEFGARIPLRTLERGVVKRTLALNRKWSIALVTYEVIERRYDEFLHLVVDGISLDPTHPESPTLNQRPAPPLPMPTTVKPAARKAETGRMLRPSRTRRPRITAARRSTSG